MSSTGSLARRSQAVLMRAVSPHTRIRPEDLEEEAPFADGREHALRHRVVPVALEVHEEDVLPRPPPGGPRLDLGQAEPSGRERLEDAVQRAHLVADREEDRGLVAPGPTGGASPDDGKARHVVRVVLDALTEGRHAV